MATNLNLDNDLNNLDNQSNTATGSWTALLALLRKALSSATNAFGSAATADTGTASGNVPVLDADSKLNESVIPDLDTAIFNGQFTQDNLPDDLPADRLDGNINRNNLPVNGIDASDVQTGVIDTRRLPVNLPSGTTLIGSGRITATESPTDTFTLDIPDGGIISDKLATNAVTKAKLAANSVGTSQLEDGSVTGIKIPAGFVTINLTTTGVAKTGRHSYEKVTGTPPSAYSTWAINQFYDTGITLPAGQTTGLAFASVNIGGESSIGVINFIIDLEVLYGNVTVTAGSVPSGFVGEIKTIGSANIFINFGVTSARKLLYAMNNVGARPRDISLFLPKYEGISNVALALSRGGDGTLILELNRTYV